MRKSKNGHGHFRDNLGALKPSSIRTIRGRLTGPGALMSLLKPFKAVFVCRQLIDNPPCISPYSYQINARQTGWGEFNKLPRLKAEQVQAQKLSEFDHTP